MSSLRGPRRTRVYDSNYNLGQSYYKPALDKLDRKYRPDPLESSSFTSAGPKLRFNLDDAYGGLDDDLHQARSRASRAITEESVFDSRGRRTLPGIPLSSAFEDDIDEDIQDSLSRIRANRKANKAASLLKDLDIEDSFSKIKRRANIDLGEKLLDVAGDDDLGTTIRSRALKMVSRTAAADELNEPLISSKSKSIVSSFKRSSVLNDSSILNDESIDSSASIRAKATKARLADIDSEISERNEKQLQREKRAANLKKLLAENDIEEVKTIKKVTF